MADTYSGDPRTRGPDWPTPAAKDNAAVVSSLKHSGPGIVSLVFGTAGVLLYALFIASVFLWVPDRPAENQPLLTRFGGPWLAIASVMVSLTGAIVGTVGAFISDRKKLFVWLGLSASLLPILTCMCMSSFTMYKLMTRTP
jgi:hypothetical protein